MSVRDIKPPVILVLPGTNKASELVMACARAVSHDLNASIHCICNQKNFSLPKLAPDVKLLQHREDTSIKDAVNSAAACADIKMIVSNWPRNRIRLESLLDLNRQKNIPAVVVRKGQNRQPHSKALILASGGPHIIHHFWAARAICRDMELNPRIIYFETSVAKTTDGAQNCSSLPFSANAARMVGIKAPLRKCHCEDIIQGITDHTTRDDMLIIGGPHYARVGKYFSGSIPDILKNNTENDLVMILGRKAPVTDLRNIFWEETICTNMPVTDKKEAIKYLIDNLIKNRQVPEKWKNYMIDKALRREAILPTSTDADTAFPHITIPGISGIIGSLGICPGGIDFGGDHASPAKFIFLMVTPKKHYEDYLTALSDIASIMISPKRRKSLLKSQTSSGVRQKLGKYQTNVCA